VTPNLICEPKGIPCDVPIHINWKPLQARQLATTHGPAPCFAGVDRAPGAHGGSVCDGAARIGETSKKCAAERDFDADFFCTFGSNLVPDS
jgi:hypothetical protein